MAVIRTSIGDLCGIMIDGFLPDSNTLHNIADNIRISCNISDNSKYYINNHICKCVQPENIMNLFFDKLKLIYLRQYCPFTDNNDNYIINGNDKEFICWHIFFSIGNNYYSLERSSKYLINDKPDSEPKKSISIKSKVAETLCNEFNNIRIHQPHKHYIQLLNIYNTDKAWIKCKKEKCLNDWINTSHFNIYPEDQYIDYNSFKGAWIELIQRYIHKYKYCSGQYSG